MQTDRRKKLFWGILGFSPWLLFFTIVPLLLFGFHYVPKMDRTCKLDTIGLIYVIGFNLEVFFVLICYLFYIGKLEGVRSGKKWQWRAFLIFGHVFAIPIFWYLYIWKQGNSRSNDKVQRMAESRR